MKREKPTAFTVVEVAKGQHVKAQFRPLFRALYLDLRDFQGGASAVADQLGKNAVVWCNKFNPDYLDHTPTLQDFLLAVEIVGARRAAGALALLVGLATVDMPTAGERPSDVVQSFMRVVQMAGELMSEAAKDLADGRLDAEERDRAAAVLDALLLAGVQMRALLRS